jgi:hypothetical protein
MMRIEPSSDAGNNRTEHEGGNLERTHVEAHQVGDALVIMDRGDRDAKAGSKQQPNQHRDAKCEHRDCRQAYERRNRITRGSADHIEIEDRCPHDFTQRKGGEREIDAPSPEHRDRHGQSNQTRSHSS